MTDEVIQTRIERINELVSACDPAIDPNGWEVPESPERFLTVEISCGEIVWAYSDATLDEAAKSIESSDTESDDCIVYDLDAYPKSYRPLMKVTGWSERSFG